MELLLEQVQHALEAGLYYLAVTSAFTIPDICAALEDRNGETSKAKYRAWYDTWIFPKYDLLTSFDMYRLRSGAVHQGIFGPAGMQYARIIFTVTDRAIHNCIFTNNGGVVESVLVLHAETFCNDVIESVREWKAAKITDPIVQANMPRLLQLRPNGLPPHFRNFPVIA